MARLLGGVKAFGLAALISAGPMVDGDASSIITEDEVNAYMVVLADAIGSCDLDAFNGFVAQNAAITMVDGGEMSQFSRGGYIELLRDFCRSGTPERDFEMSSMACRTEGEQAMVSYVLRKDYQLGVFRPRQIKAVLTQRFTVARTPSLRLQAIRIFQQTVYEDAARPGSFVPLHEAQPAPSVTRLQRILLGPWLAPADTELEKDPDVSSERR